ncbi:MAG: FAD-binding oxidoreductase [Acetobacteraceae bacterium]
MTSPLSGHLAALAERLRGTVLTPGSPSYDPSRRVWNGMVDKRPAALVRCAAEEDVALAVAFAREHGLPLAVRGGGHSISGVCLCDGGIVVDFSDMRSVSVDPVCRTATAGAGARLGDFDAATQEHGLATTMGVNTDTGIAGLTLGGGVGRLGHKHGLACDNLLSARVVLADGRAVTASTDEHPDLFWALRGGGGNFGVVTHFTYRLHPLGPTITGGLLVYDWRDARAAMQLYARYLPQAPEDVDVLGVLLTLPGQGPAFAMAVFHGGNEAAAEADLQPLRRGSPKPLQDAIGRMPYVDLQASADDLFLPGRRFYWKTHFLHRLDDGLIDVLLDRFEHVPSPQSLIAMQPLGGAIARVPVGATAFANRDAMIDLIPTSIWEDHATDAANITWVRDIWQASRRFSTGGVYVNNLGDEGDERVQDAYGANFRRLIEVKTKYDPDNVFRMNQNIRPA